MQKTQLIKKNKNVSPRRILSAVIALLVLFILFTSVIALSRKYFDIRKRVEHLKEQEIAMKERYNDLKQTNEYIQTSEGQERELRSKYNIVKPGEEMIVVSAPDPAVEEKSGSFGRWWEGLLRGLNLKN